MVAVLPLLLYPALGIGMAQMLNTFSEQTRTVVVIGAADLPDPPLLEPFEGHQRFLSRWFAVPADAGLAERTAEHAGLQRLAERLRRAGEAISDTPTALPAIEALEASLHAELLPHQREEERALYPAAARRLGGHDPMGPLVRMHTEIEALAARISALAAIARREGGWAEVAPELRRSIFALEALLTLHLAAEEEVLAEFVEEPFSAGAAPPRRAAAEVERPRAVAGGR